MKKQNIGKFLIIIITLVSVIAIFFIDPIQQDLAYHQFVDVKKHYDVTNFWNVISNLPFFLVGAYALIRFNCMEIISEMRVAYWLFFFGVMLVAFGSGYYHLMPSNDTLVWDRLPMTIAFMSLFSIIISEFIDIKLGAKLLIPLIFMGVLSVLYWQWTESNGVGDLRLYAIVQFLPIVLIPIMLLFYPTKFTKVSGYWLLLSAYVAAKILENYDADIFEIMGNTLSGHSIKHVVAAIGVLFLFLGFKNRERINTL